MRRATPPGFSGCVVAGDTRITVKRKSAGELPAPGADRSPNFCFRGQPRSVSPVYTTSGPMIKPASELCDRPLTTQQEGDHMCVKAIDWTIRQGIKDPLTKLLLMVLANHKNSDDGRCFPAIGDLAWECNCSQRSIQRQACQRSRARRDIAGANHQNGSKNRVTKAPPDERGGNGYVRPTATAPHLDSTLKSWRSGLSSLTKVACMRRL